MQTAWLALGLAMVCGSLELLAGPAYRLGWLTLSAGVLTVRWAATAAAALAVFALLGAAFGTRPARMVWLLSSLIAVSAAAPPAVLWYRVQHLPRLHDVSTDTVDPPQYAALLPLRTGARNSTVYDFGLAALQLQGYPDVRPLMLTAPADQAFQKALAAARAMGWEIVEADRDALRIEATDTSILFGFKDDVVIRIRAQDGGSRIDLRSLSRVGGSDFGVNADRIRRFVDRLTDTAA